MLTPVLLHLNRRFGRDIAQLIFDYSDGLPFLTVIAKAYLTLELQLLNVLEEVEFAPHAIAADRVGRQYLPFKLQFVACLAPIQPLLQSREDRLARMLRRAPFRLPTFTRHRTTRTYSNYANDRGWQCVCGSIRHVKTGLLSPTHLNSRTHLDEFEGAVAAILCRDWLPKEDIEGLDFREFWNEALAFGLRNTLQGFETRSLWDPTFIAERVAGRDRTPEWLRGLE